MFVFIFDNNVQHRGKPYYLGIMEMANKVNSGLKAAVSIIINEDLSALKNVVKKLTNTPPKTDDSIRNRARGKK